MKTTTTSSTSGQGATWPGAFGIIKPAREATMRAFVTLIVLAFIEVAISIISPHVNFKLTPHGSRKLSPGIIRLALLSSCLSVAISALLSGAFIQTYVQAARGKSIGLGDAFGVAVKRWWRLILLNLLVGLSVAGALAVVILAGVVAAWGPWEHAHISGELIGLTIFGALVLLVPAIYLAIRLSAGPYFLVDKDLSVMQAYKGSWHATRHNMGKVWGLIGVTFLFSLIAITIIGIPVAIVMVFLYGPAFALYYLYLIGDYKHLPQA